VLLLVFAWMRSYVRKIVMSGLVAAATLLGCAAPAFAGTGMTGTTGAVTAAPGGKTVETAFRQAIGASNPANSAAVRFAASYLGRLAAQPLASGSTSNITAGTKISCASPTACLSVGTHEVSSSTASTVTPFAARLHAGTWKAVPVKVPAGSPFTALTDVSCKAATYCLAVGLTAAKSGVGSYAATWNGRALTPIAAPPLPARTLGYSQAVSCVAVNSCVAIGYALSVTGDATSTVIWTWNGAKWTRAVVPGKAHVVPLYAGLRCFSLTSCVAAGHLDVAISGAGSDTPMAVAWNGTSLTSLNPGLNVGVDNSAQFNALSCVSPHSCVAVGAQNTGSSVWGSTGSFAEVWNGKTWAVTKWSGPAGDTTAVLLGVSCTSAVRCIAVGTHGTAKAAAPAALAWNGSKWTVLKVAGPGTGKAAYFAGISCPVNGKCLTTGATGKPDGSTATPIAGYWNGSAWKYGPMLPAAA
jgi:hypothetical protein